MVTVLFPNARTVESMSTAENEVNTTARCEAAAQRILTDQLPIAVRTRWQPLRAGLMNVFLFEDERFPFADGRLLLRGSNGTGKSRVLAMTLPLLLDGSFKATRVEPDRDPNRQVAWNLLMDDGSSATGYSWLEFGRLDEGNEAEKEPQEHVLTIGCGMRAKQGQRIKPWFFITELRVDESLELKSSDGVPLTQRQLAEKLGDSGQVFETASEYRRAVDEKLFRLGERYDALIDLLLQLRQPKLAEKLDIVQLESMLREALPPLPESLLDDAADAFRELDDYRRALVSDRVTLQDIQKFLKPYRDHVQRGVKRSLKDLTSSNSRYAQAQRDLRTLAEQKEEQAGTRSRLESQQRTLRVEIESGRAAISELQQSPEMQSAQRLDEQNERARGLIARVKESAGEFAKRENEFADAQQQQDSIAQEAKYKRQSVAEESDKCRHAAAPEALQNFHQEQIATCLQDDSLDRFADCKKSLTRRAAQFRKSAKYLIEVNELLDKHRRALKSTQEAVERHEQSRQAKVDRMQTARQQCDQDRGTLWKAILEWYEEANVLKAFLPSIESWGDQWDVWPGDVYHTDPSVSIVETAKSKRVAELISERERLRHQVEQTQSQVSILQDEQTRLESGQPIAPPPRAHRAPAIVPNTGEGENGIPFWLLVEFKPTVPQNERGNWEAALHDAGLLDAVLLPDGRLVTENVAGDDVTEVQLAHAGMNVLEENRQLAQVLQPAAESELAEGQQLLGNVARQQLELTLRVIGVGRDAGKTWVAHDGRWRNGPLHGRLTKPQPQYIGTEARDRWRHSRLDEIAREHQAIMRQQTGLEEQIATTVERQAEVKSYTTAFPSPQRLLSSTTAVTTAQKEADEAAHQLQQAQRQEAAQRNVLDAATRKRDEDAADSGLSTWATKAIELRDRLEKYAAGLDTLEARIDALRSAIAQVGRSSDAVHRAKERWNADGDRLNKSKIELGQAQERVRVLEESAGQNVAVMIERLNVEREQQGKRETRAEGLSEEITKVEVVLGVVQNKLEQREKESASFDEQRYEATEWFSMLHENELIQLAAKDLDIPDLPWSMTVAIKLARQIDTMLASVPSDEDPWLTSQSRLHMAQTELQQTALSHNGMAVEVEPLRDGLQLVKLTLQGERLGPIAAASRLEAEITTRETILDAKEQETLEKYLLGEVAEGLRKGMRMASELVELMTSEVSKRPMKTGMQMRFKWRQDDEGPAGLAEACEVLASDAATWSPDEREQIKQFLQRSIRRQSEAQETGTWHEHMRAALDYRRWHRIVIERRSGPDANWLRLTRRTYAGGSGGEKAIALTLPPLAAAAAYYRSADPLAPRFILLDEAFAGISLDMRESCMELISAFELDVVMTSEIEWGMYAGVKQLAICQLDRFSDINAVVNRVFIWNGSEKRQMVSREEAAEQAKQPLLRE